jgi:quinohemoprotein ethanol dehydrogenase
LADQGAYEYGVRCTVCHGWNAVSAGMAPDLRASPILASGDAFAEVVRNGALQKNGMPVFEHLLDEQLLAIRHYVRREAENAMGE